MILQKGRRNWIRTEDLKTLGWLTIPQIAVEASMRTFLKTLELKRPQNLYERPWGCSTYLSVQNVLLRGW